jgi:hypothetical protein
MKKSKKKEMKKLKKVADTLFELAQGYDYIEDVVTVYQGEVIVTPVQRHKEGNAWAAAKILDIKNREDYKKSEQVRKIEVGLHDLTLACS